MPTTLTDSSSFDAMTAPIGSDIRNASSVRTCLQAAANRDRFVYDMVRPLADLAALKAIVSPTDGTVRTVATTGAYVFVAAYVGGEVLPWVVAPTSGSGKWVHVIYGLTTHANGIELRTPFVRDIADLKDVPGPAEGMKVNTQYSGAYTYTEIHTNSDPEPDTVPSNFGPGQWIQSKRLDRLMLVDVQLGTFEPGLLAPSDSVDLSEVTITVPESGGIAIIDAWVALEISAAPTEGIVKIQLIKDPELSPVLDPWESEVDIAYSDVVANTMVSLNVPGTWRVVLYAEHTAGSTGISLRNGGLRVQMMAV